MVFYGLVLTGSKQEVDIRQGFSLQILQACVDIPNTKVGSKIVTVYLQPGGCSTPYVLCHLGDGNCYSGVLQQELCVEDGPVKLWCTENATVHVTGRWCEIQEEEDEGEEELCQQVLPATQPVSTSGNKRQRGGRDAPASSSATSASSAASATTAKSSSRPGSDVQDKKKKAKAAEDAELLALAEMMRPSALAEPPSASDPQLKLRKKWRVKPEGDEGVLVPEPKQRTLASGVLVTDYIVGKGIEPKLGCKIKILYEGSFPNGTVFDSRLKKTKPFVFRKGATEVIRGLDLGVEGLRVGGSREIIIPPALGYVLALALVLVLSRVLVFVLALALY